MARLIMCLGLPGSGKSTWAANESQGSISVVNKDRIRRELESKGWVWSRENEVDVIKIRDERIAADLAAGLDVISDDTNLAPKNQNQLKALANKFRAKFEVKDFRGVPIEVCIERDAKREGKAKVGRDVIVKMATQYLNYSEPLPKFAPYTYDLNLPSIVLCDLDGTLAIHVNRSPFEYHKCGTDKVNEPVAATLDALRLAGRQIIFMSGRDDSCRGLTEKWLDEAGYPNPTLHMRQTGDTRKDWIVKGELLEAHIRGKFNVLLALDDRDQVVKFYRELGLTVLQVAEGSF